LISFNAAKNIFVSLQIDAAFAGTAAQLIVPPAGFQITVGAVALARCR
jgi:hypothetical protein